MPVPLHPPASVRFGPFELSKKDEELRKHGVRLKLSGQALHVLAVLVENAGQVVTREELQRKLWPGSSFGDFEHGLNAAVNRLRETLGDSAAEPTIIETVPRRGYRFIARVEPEAAPTPTAAPSVKASSESSPRRNLPVWATIAAVVAIVSATTVVLLSRKSTESPKATFHEAPLTSYPGWELSPTFSPDGTQVAFAWDGGHTGKGFNAYVKVVGTEKALQLTDQRGNVQLSLAWSPDGINLAEERFAGSDSGIYLLPVLGGIERKLTSVIPAKDDDTTISWSPDGKWIAFTDHIASSSISGSSELFLLNTNSLERELLPTGCESVGLPAFSPDGRAVAFVCQNSIEEGVWLKLIRLSDRRLSTIVKIRTYIAGLAWVPNSTRLIYSVLDENRDTKLAMVATDAPPREGAARVEILPFGAGASGIAISNSGKRLAFTKVESSAHIWKKDLSGQAPEVQQLLSSSRWQSDPNISPDGKRIAFISNRSGTQEIWTANADGTEPTAVSALGGGGTGTARWAPDSQHLAFDSRIGGEANLYVADILTRRPQKLVLSTKGNYTPNWSHDGKWIYYTCGTSSVYKTTIDGGRSVHLSDNAFLPIESPDGQFVYFLRTLNSRDWLWRMRPDGTGQEQVPGMVPIGGITNGWVPFDDGIYFISDLASPPTIEFFDLRTRRVRFVHRLAADVGWSWGGLSVAPDQKWLVYTQLDSGQSDLVLVDGVKF